MPRPNLIATHDSFQRVPYTQFHSWYWQDRQPGIPMPRITGTRGIVEAVVNYGRWLVECPTGDGHAVYASPGDLWYLCTICGNSTNNGKPYRVVFPSDRAAIENVLMFRPVDRRHPVSQPWESKARNWTPAESLQDLKDENIANGLPAVGTAPREAP